jgi:ferredoxin
MALMAGTEPAAVPTIRIAGERGLGPTDRAGLEIRGDFAVLPGFRMPSAGIADRLARASPVIYGLLQRRPLAVRRSCTQCGVCARACPVKAIVLAPYPEIRRSLCTSCFCCCELCPDRAMKIPGLARSVLRNVLRK